MLKVTQKIIKGVNAIDITSYSEEEIQAASEARKNRV